MTFFFRSAFCFVLLQTFVLNKGFALEDDLNKADNIPKAGNVCQADTVCQVDNIPKADIILKADNMRGSYSLDKTFHPPHPSHGRSVSTFVTATYGDELKNQPFSTDCVATPRGSTTYPYKLLKDKAEKDVNPYITIFSKTPGKEGNIASYTEMRLGNLETLYAGAVLASHNLNEKNSALQIENSKLKTTQEISTMIHTDLKNNFDTDLKKIYRKKCCKNDEMCVHYYRMLECVKLFIDKEATNIAAEIAQRSHQQLQQQQRNEIIIGDILSPNSSMMQETVILNTNVSRINCNDESLEITVIALLVQRLKGYILTEKSISAFLPLNMTDKMVFVDQLFNNSDDSKTPLPLMDSYDFREIAQSLPFDHISMQRCARKKLPSEDEDKNDEQNCERHHGKSCDIKRSYDGDNEQYNDGQNSSGQQYTVEHTHKTQQQDREHEKKNITLYTTTVGTNSSEHVNGTVGTNSSEHVAGRIKKKKNNPKLQIDIKQIGEQVEMQTNIQIGVHIANSGNYESANNVLQRFATKNSNDAQNNEVYEEHDGTATDRLLIWPRYTPKTTPREVINNGNDPQSAENQKDANVGADAGAPNRRTKARDGICGCGGTNGKDCSLI